MIVEDFISNSDNKVATASMMSSLGSDIYNFFENKIDKENKIASFLAILTPGAILNIFFTISGVKYKIIGALFALVASVFNIEIQGIFTKVINSLVNYFKSNEQITQPELDSLINDSVGSQSADDGKVSSAKLYKDFKVVKIICLTKNAKLNLSSGIRSKIWTVFTVVIRFFFKYALLGAGLLYVGDKIRSSIMGKENSPASAGATEGTGGGIIDGIKSMVGGLIGSNFNDQSKKNPSISVSISPTEENISKLLLSWMSEENKDINENEVINLPTFKEMVSNLVFYNRFNSQMNLTVIPPIFTNKKDVINNIV